MKRGFPGGASGKEPAWCSRHRRWGQIQLLSGTNSKGATGRQHSAFSGRLCNWKSGHFRGCSLEFSQFSRVWLFATPWTEARQASLSITNSWSLLKLVCIELVMPSNHLILCRPLLLLPSIFPSIRVLSNESVLCIMWLKYWSFSFNISPSNEYSGLISFRMDWLGLLAVQGTLESSPTSQFESINYSMLSFLNSPTLTSIHDHWKNHSLD